MVPSVEDVRRFLEAATSLRDKLLIGMMYATGMRVSEVSRGKRKRNRIVTLPTCYETILKALAKQHQPEGCIFTSAASAKLHRSTVQRVLARTCCIALTDTYAAGCITSYLSSALPAAKREILQNCSKDLQRALEEETLSEEVRVYFDELRDIANAVLATTDETAAFAGHGVQHRSYARPRLRLWSIARFATPLASVTSLDLQRRGHRLFGNVVSFW